MKEIEKIIEAYKAIDFNEQQAALATVVRVEQSSYRRIGARMLVKNNGDWIGGISGGCLEGDALKRAKMAILKNRSSIVTYDTTQDDAQQIGVGLGCRGRIDVLFSPLHSGRNAISPLMSLSEKRTPSILYHIIGVAPSQATLLGVIYTNEEETDLINKLGITRDTINTWKNTVVQVQQSRIFKITDQDEVLFEVLVEFIRPKIKLVIIGDNYDVDALITIGKSLAWAVEIAGKRIMMNRFAVNNTQKTYPIKDANKIKIDAFTAIVLMSHDYKTDVALLPHFFSQKPRYIGILGPRKRMIQLQEDLGDEIRYLDAKTIFAPVGLDIGAETPEEIAVAIAAEIIAVFRKRSGQPLRERSGSIH